MKKLFLILLLSMPLLLFAQTENVGILTIFSEKGDKFFLYLNGEKKNDQSMTKVRVAGLTQLSYNVKIVYDDASHFTITKSNVFISDGDDNLMDVSYKIIRNGGSARLKFYSMNPVRKTSAADTAVSKFNNGDAEALSGSLHVFSDQKDPFFLFINGEKQNEVAQYDIRVENLTRLFYNVKVIFKDSKLNPVSRNNVSISDGDDNLMDASYRISRTSWYGKLKFYSMNTANPAFVPTPGMYVHKYGEPSSTDTYAAVQVIKKPEASPVVKKDSVRTPVKEVKQVAVKKSETKEKKTVANAAPVVSVKEKAPSKKPVIENNNTVVTTPDAVAIKNTMTVKEPEDWVCQNEWPMWKADYATAKKNIAEAKTEKLKLAAARLLVSKNCLSSDQVAEIGALLPSEESKLEFAKLAFNHTIDIKNYFKVIRIFSSMKHKEILTEYVGG